MPRVTEIAANVCNSVREGDFFICLDDEEKVAYQVTAILAADCVRVSNGNELLRDPATNLWDLAMQEDGQWVAAGMHWQERYVFVGNTAGDFAVHTRRATRPVLWQAGSTN